MWSTLISQERSKITSVGRSTITFGEIKKDLHGKLTKLELINDSAAQQGRKWAHEHHLCLRGPAVNSVRSMRRIHNNIKYCVIERSHQDHPWLSNSRCWGKVLGARGRNRREARQKPVPWPASLHIMCFRSTASSLSLYTLRRNVTSDLAS